MITPTTTPDSRDKKPASHMTLGVYVLHSDGTRHVLRPTAPVKPATEVPLDGVMTYPPCACPIHLRDQEAQR